MSYSVKVPKEDRNTGQHRCLHQSGQRGRLGKILMVNLSIKGNKNLMTAEVTERLTWTDVLSP